MKTPLYKRYGFWIAIIAVILVAAIGIELAVELSDTRVSTELSVEECQKIVDSTFEQLPVSNTGVARYVINNTKITVNSVDYGIEKDIILSCTYETLDTKAALSGEVENLMIKAYEYTLSKPSASGTDIDLKCIRKPMLDLIKTAQPISGEITLYIYETSHGFTLYLGDEIVDTCTGGIISITKAIDNTTYLNYKGELICPECGHVITSANPQGQHVDITKNGSLRTGVSGPLALANHESTKPFTGGPLIEAIRDFTADVQKNFLDGNRYMHLVRGLGTTLLLTLFAALFGIFLGFIIAIVRCTNQMTGALKLPDAICRLYLTIMRGTPVMVQLLIMHFVVFSPMGIKPFMSAIICFGLNSGAYVAEIVRGGIMSIDKGQIEAGRSLGFNYVQTMVHFVVPQAFKAILPSLANEFITLLKESSVAFAIGLGDLTFGGNLIRSVTYSPFLPLLAVALIYLILVMILSKFVSILERRLAKSDR